MNSLKATICRGIVSVMVCFTVLSVNSALAEKISLYSSIFIGEEYSDNISFERGQTREDFINSISPSIGITYSTDQTTISSHLELNILRHASETNEDRENQSYNLKGSNKITERLVLEGYVSYRKDSTLETELIETGELTHRQDSQRYAGITSLSWSLSELSNVAMKYDYLKRDLQSSYYDRHAVSVSFSKSFNSGIDTISVGPSYTFRNSDSSELNNYNISITWLHHFRERCKFNTSLGGRYSEERYDDGDTVESNGIVIGVGATWNTETGGMTFGYTRDLFTNTSGGESEVDRFRYIYNRRILQRLWAHFSGNLYFRRRPDGSSKNDETYYKISPSLSYKLTEWNNLNLGYSYSNEYEKAILNHKTVDENRVWLNISFNHNKVW